MHTITRTLRMTVVLTLLAGVAACSDNPAGASEEAAETLLADALGSTPVGFSATENTYAGADDDTWRPRARRHAGRGGPFGSAFGAGFMGGGLAPDFATGDGFRAGLARGPFGGPFGGGLRAGDCTFDATLGRAVCTPATPRPGLTVERWVIWTDVNGVVQRAPDSTTASMQSHAEVFGTVPMRDSATRTVRHVSDRLITGLEKGSTQRVVNGTSNGSETVNGFVPAGAFIAERLVADTTRDLVIPVSTQGRTYPISGTVIRSMQVEVSVAGGAAETATWREVLTYDGTDTATLVITRNGATKTCSVPLPVGRPVCG